ncbi:SKP1-like protein [Citrus sinensis]|nr:SKP1-like protein [Citrus sinensis]
MATTSTVKLRSGDNEVFEVEKQVMIQSGTIRNMIEDDAADGEIPLQISSRNLAKVVEWCKCMQHRDRNNNNDNKEEEEEEEEWEKKFDEEIPALLHRLCQLAADIVKGKTPEEIRRTFNIKKDFTPEEEEAVMDEHGWAFHD